LNDFLTFHIIFREELEAGSSEIEEGIAEKAFGAITATLLAAIKLWRNCITRLAFLAENAIIFSGEI
jgi:hypothetical protein